MITSFFGYMFGYMFFGDMLSEKVVVIDAYMYSLKPVVGR